jgi:excisionase family DNA binding protein
MHKLTPKATQAAPGIFDPERGVPFNDDGRPKTPAPVHAVGKDSPDLPMPGAGKLALSLDEAAVLLGCCKKTLERQRDAGKLHCLRLGRHWKVRRAELEAYLRRLETES